MPLGRGLSAAYQINPKTVFRGGWGVNYQFIANPAGATIGTNGVYPLAGINPYVNIATPGSIVQPTWPVTDPNIYPPPGTVGIPGVSTPYVPDANENRPPRINQWSVGFQREITKDFIVEASYVANRAAWLPSGPLGFLSQISPQKYASYHLYPYPGTGPCSGGGGSLRKLQLQQLRRFPADHSANQQPPGDQHHGCAGNHQPAAVCQLQPV